MSDSRLASRLPAKLRRILEDIPQMALLFSGGIDSRFLGRAAHICGCDVLAIHAFGPHIPNDESDIAPALARQLGLRYGQIRFDPLSIPEVRHNSRERCYGCKKGLIAAVAKRLAATEHFGRVICDGSNADDCKVFRPGQRALAEARVKSPLAQAGLGKAQIRALAGAIGVPFPEQPSRPCLLTRLNYGLTPDPLDLEKIANCESAVADVLTAYDCADINFRLRLLPRPILQLSRFPAAAEKALLECMAKYGFRGAEIWEWGDEISGFFDKPGENALN